MAQQVVYLNPLNQTPWSKYKSNNSVGTRSNVNDSSVIDDQTNSLLGQRYGLDAETGSSKWVLLHR